MVRAVRSVAALLVLACSTMDTAVESPGGPMKRSGPVPSASARAAQPSEEGAPAPEGAPHPAAEPSCGAPRPNPYGYEWSITEADGSCEVCERPPEPLAACARPLRAKNVTAGTLRASVGRRVRLHGVLGFQDVTCTTRGGPCACENRCGALLKLWSRDTPRRPLRSKEERRRERAEILEGRRPHEPPQVDPVFTVLERPVSDAGQGFSPYMGPDGVLACSGDEHSLCCPFALDRESLKVQVIVEGTVRTAQSIEDDAMEYRILVENVCRVPD